MSVDKDTVRRIAKLARIALDEDRVEPMVAELNSSPDSRDKAREPTG